MISAQRYLLPCKVGPGAREIALTCAMVGAILAAGVLALGGARNLGDMSARLATSAPILVGGGTQPAALPEVARLAGRWINAKGLRIIITDRGEVWSDSGRMEGFVASTPPQGSNFAFGDGRFACRYMIVFSGDDATDWRLVSAAQGSPCPSGHFERPVSLSH